MMRFVTLILLAALLPLLCACEEKKEPFSGIHGRVGFGPVEGAKVRIYDASLFKSFTDNAGFVAEVETDQFGDFQIDIADDLIGRPMLVIAEFPADDLMTAEDERATTVGFDDQVVTLEPSDGPWVSMLDFFDGLTVDLSVSPLTNLAYENLKNADSGVVGLGNNRYFDQHMHGTNSALGHALGLDGDFAGYRPTRVNAGANFPDARQETYAISDQLAFVYAQLDLAGRDFSAQTTDAGDSSSDFFRALNVDARDGTLDGRSFGVSIPYLASAGAPDVLGLNAMGYSKLLTYFESFAVTAAPFFDGVIPDAKIVEIRDAQKASFGGSEIIRVDRISRTRWGQSEVFEVEIWGQGFGEDLELVYGANESARFSPIGSVFVTDFENDNPKAGQILEVRHNYLRFRTPDFPTFATEYLPSTSEPSRPFNLFLRRESDDPENNDRNVVYRHVSEIELVYTRTLNLVQTGLILDGPNGETEVQAASGASNVDPSTLNPVVEEVLNLECVLFNGMSVDLNNVALDLSTSEVTLSNGSALSLGDLVADGDLIFATQATLDAAAVTIPSRSAMTLRFPFVVNSNAVGNTIQVGQTLVLKPRFKGVKSDTMAALLSDDENHDEGSPKAFSLFSADLAPAPATNAVNAPAALAAMASGQLEWVIDLAGVNSATSRALLIERVDIEIRLNGTLVHAEAVKSARGNWTIEVEGEVLRGIGISDALGQLGPGMETSAGPLTLSFDLDHLGANLGTMNIALAIQWREASSGASGTLNESVDITLN